MKFVNYLFFNGNCREAFEFYADVFDGQVVGLVTYRDEPGESSMPADWQDKVMNVQLSIGDQSLMAFFIGLKYHVDSLGIGGGTPIQYE